MLGTRTGLCDQWILGLARVQERGTDMENRRVGCLVMRLLRGLSLFVYNHRSEQLKWGRVPDHWRKGART